MQIDVEQHVKAIKILQVYTSNHSPYSGYVENFVYLELWWVLLQLLLFFMTNSRGQEMQITTNNVQSNPRHWKEQSQSNAYV